MSTSSMLTTGLNPTVGSLMVITPGGVNTRLVLISKEAGDHQASLDTWLLCVHPVYKQTLEA